MLFFAYLIPLVACLILKIGFDYDGKWTSYLWFIIIGEATVGILHLIFYSLRTSSNEYLGAFVTKISYIEPWTELIEQQVQKRDANGNSYVVTEIKEKFHKEEYFFFTNLNARIKTDSHFYYKIKGIWQTPEDVESWSGKHIKGGIRFARHHHFADVTINGPEDHDKFILISQENSYTNKIKNSNSIYRSVKVSKKEAKELGLYEWPTCVEYDVPCILSHHLPVPKELDKLYRRFNALVAPERQMRLFILLFDGNMPMEVAEKQRAYWKGGNKNEFTICLGVDSDEYIRWVYSFSWSAENLVEIEVNQWFLNHRKLDLYGFLNWFSFEFLKWERRQFKDFKYIRVELLLWQTITIMVAAVLESIYAIYYFLNY